MADKRISQLVERTDIANNDVVPIVASGATTTNKATISSIQEFMQENLDLGVTSVGITLGSSGTDVSVTGSPITTSGNITINFPTASATNRGLLSSADWTTFNDKQPAGNYVTLDTAQTITAQKVFTTSGSSDSVIITHGSGSGFALDVIKAGNGEVVRVNKTSGSGNAMSIIGGNFGAEAATFSGVVTTTPDAVINGVNVGKGGGSVATNVRVGNQTLTFNTTGSSNTSVGFSSLYFNTTGSRNTSVGVNSLQNNTTASGNTGVGNSALQNNTTGFGNTATGDFTLISNTTGSGNTAAGAASMYLNTTGASNTSVGRAALENNTTGNFNIAVGDNAGSLFLGSGNLNTITNNSIFIGTDSRALANNQTNQIVIGHLAIGNGSNTVTLGNDSITNTYLKGAVTLTGALNGTSATFGGGITLTGAQTIQTSTGNLTLATAGGNGNILLSPNGTGRVGIGTPTPSEVLHILRSAAQINATALLESATGQAVVRLLAGSGSTNRASRIDFFNGVSSVTVPRWSLINDFFQNGTNDFSIVGENVRKIVVFQTGNVVIQNGGTFTDAGFRLDVNGTARVSGAATFSSTVETTGIKFPAVQVASADANTLDDYEEGTWTPSVGGTATYNAANKGIYTKIGNVVTCQFRVHITLIGTGSASVLSGFPFAAANISDVQSGHCSYYESLAVNTIYLSLYIENNATTASFAGQATSGATVATPITLFGNGTIVYGQITYRTS